MNPFPLVRIGSVPLAQVTQTALVDHVFAELAHRNGGWLITANLDHLVRYERDPAVQQLYAGADLVVADGAPLIWAARLRGTPLPERVAGSDLVWGLARAAAEHGRSLYLLGGAPGSNQAAAEVFEARFPGLRIAGAESPEVSADPGREELDALRGRLLAAEPDLVFVALGSPKQERVIAALRASLPASWWLGVGISLSFAAGDVRRAPPWMRASGLEWLHRLAQEPRRLAGRYLADDLPYALRLLARSLRERLRSEPSSKDGGRG